MYSSSVVSVGIGFIFGTSEYFSCVIFSSFQQLPVIGFIAILKVKR
jgi:hypothetical protein